MTDATTPEQPRTAAGRALLTGIARNARSTFTDEERDDWTQGILAIEAQARPVVASEGLRAALERLSDMHEAGATTEAVWQYAWEQARAALAAPAPPAGLTIAEIQAILDEAQA